MPDERDAAHADPAATAADAATPARGAVDAGDDRAAERLGFDRLLDALVPALIAKLGTLNVGELEIRRDDWRVRLQRPAGGATNHGRRATDRTGDRAGARSYPAHDGVAGPGSAGPGGRGAAPAGTMPLATAAGATVGAALTPVGPGHGVDAGAGAAGDRSETGRIATSPAVGVFQPGQKAVGGTRVRAGDRLGVVDMLGIPHDVVAPSDGIVVGVIAEAGTAVEYGQELIRLEAAAPAEAR